MEDSTQSVSSTFGVHICRVLHSAGGKNSRRSREAIIRRAAKSERRGYGKGGKSASQTARVAADAAAVAAGTAVRAATEAAARPVVPLEETHIRELTIRARWRLRGGGCDVSARLDLVSQLFG